MYLHLSHHCCTCPHLGFHWLPQRSPALHSAYFWKQHPRWWRQSGSLKQRKRRLRRVQNATAVRGDARHIPNCETWPVLVATTISHLHLLHWLPQGFHQEVPGPKHQQNHRQHQQDRLHLAPSLRVRNLDGLQILDLKEKQTGDVKKQHMIYIYIYICIHWFIYIYIYVFIYLFIIRQYNIII